MAKANFYLKNPTEKDETLIYLFYNYDGQRLKYSTGEKVPPKYWNEEDQRVKKSFTGCLEMNGHLDRVDAGIKKVYREGLNKGKSLTNEYLKEELEKELFPSGKASNGFFDLLKEFKEVQKASKTNRTIQKYQTLYNHLTDFQSLKKYILTFEKIDSRFYELFTTYCINDLKLLNNSIAKYIKTLKTFLHWATARGYNNNLSFTKFKAKEKDADIIYLSEAELFSMYEHDFSNNPAQENVRDCFCFGCFTGLRFSDIARVDKKSIKGDEIHLVSEKTTERLIIPLNSYAKAILKKHNYSLPLISNQKTNDHLKKIGEDADIDEPIMLTKFRGAEEIQITKPKYKFIGTHTARRTFVTLSLEKGMRPETVMNIVGHKEYATFKKYIKITSKVKLVEMKNIWDKKENILKAV